MKLVFSLKNFIIFSVAFFLFTIIGTILHEYGHLLVAKSLGYETKLHYGSMSYQKYNSNINDTIIELFERNKYAIQNKKDFTEKLEFYTLVNKQQKDSFLIRIGGPFQTIITGLIGFFLLYKRNRLSTSHFTKIDWFLVFLSLFWLRQIFNPVFSVLKRFFRGNGTLFGRGDETEIAKYLNLPIGTIDVILGLIGLFICFFVVFKLTPIKHRYTFILSGLIGGSLGFYIWMYKIGPLILP
ncbi:hypothetical protein [uncultured Flavobacterium sp.]|uniref:hypothetical protein n=1 Tax=uncultured Flavobacterium sp. TaxID=165435 RepID=UPI0030ED33D5|tara:strand:- start:112831 stop:113550 length:720 start_codon:yes stop_codon:yes gene_type:complete